MLSCLLKRLPHIRDGNYRNCSFPAFVLGPSVTEIKWSRTDVRQCMWAAESGCLGPTALEVAGPLGSRSPSASVVGAAAHSAVGEREGYRYSTQLTVGDS